MAAEGCLMSNINFRVAALNAKATKFENKTLDTS